MKPSFTIGMGAGRRRGRDGEGISGPSEILKNVTPRAAKVRSGLAPEGAAHEQRGGGEIAPFKKKEKKKPKKPTQINERARNAGC